MKDLGWRQTSMKDGARTTKEKVGPLGLPRHRMGLSKKIKLLFCGGGLLGPSPGRRELWLSARAALLYRGCCSQSIYLAADPVRKLGYYIQLLCCACVPLGNSSYGLHSSGLQTGRVRCMESCSCNRCPGGALVKRGARCQWPVRACQWVRWCGMAWHGGSCPPGSHVRALV